MRVKCIEEKLKITKENTLQDPEELLRVVGDHRFDSGSCNYTEQILTPNFYQRFEDECANSEKIELNLKFRYYASQNGIPVSTIFNANKKCRYIHFKCIRRTIISKDGIQSDKKQDNEDEEDIVEGDED